MLSNPKDPYNVDKYDTRQELRDKAYAREQLDVVVADFRARNLSPYGVVNALMEVLIKYLPGDPWEKTPHEEAIEDGIRCLTSAAHDLDIRVKAYQKADRRALEARLRTVAAEKNISYEEAVAAWHEEFDQAIIDWTNNLDASSRSKKIMD